VIKRWVLPPSSVNETNLVQSRAQNCLSVHEKLKTFPSGELLLDSQDTRHDNKCFDQKRSVGRNAWGPGPNDKVCLLWIKRGCAIPHTLL